MRLLQHLQTRAADRWAFVPYPRLYRPIRDNRRSAIDTALKWGIFSWLMLAIWGSVALGILILAITAIGTS